VTLPLWDDPDEPDEPAPRRWKSTCDDCGRRIWSADALRPRFGGHYGSKCARRSLRLATSRRAAGDVPGQLALDEQPAEPHDPRTEEPPDR
jgi:hypothetical protein